MAFQQQGRCVLLIDNGYLSAILRDEYSQSRIDYLKLSNTICNGYSRLRTYVYDALPYQANPPTPEQRILYAGKVKFFDALRKLPSFEVRFGKQRPRAGGFIQKGVDILLTVDLIRLASKSQIQKAFLIAGDADFVPVVRAARDEGVSVHLYYSSAFQNIGGKQLPKYSNELWDCCDERTAIDGQLINNCSFASATSVTSPKQLGKQNP